MTDIATVGYKADTSGLKQAEAALESFGKATSEAALEQGGLEAAAKRSMRSVEEMAARVKNADANIRRIRENTAAATGSTRKHSEEIEKAAKATDKLSAAQATALAGLKRLLIPLTGVVFSGAAFTAMRAAVATVADIGDAATKVGVTTDELQKFGYAAEQSGASAKQMDAALEALTRQMGLAANQSGNLYKLFQANNMQVSGSTSENWLRLADLVENAATQSDKMAIVTAVLGRGVGGDMIQALSKGSVGLQGLGAEAEKLGIILRKDVIDEADRIDKEFKKMEASASSLAKSWAVYLGGVLLNAINSATQEMSLFAQMVNDLKNGNYADAMLGTGALREFVSRKRSLSSDENEQRDYARRLGYSTPEAMEQPADVPNSGGVSWRPFTEKPTNTPNFNARSSTKKSEMDRTLLSVEKQTEALERQAAAFGLSAAAAQKLRVEDQLLDAAMRAGIPITDEMSQRIEALAERAGKAAGALEQLRLAQEVLEISGRDAVKGIAQDLLAGKTAAEAFKNALDRVASRLLDLALDQGFKAMINGGGGWGRLLGISSPSMDTNATAAHSWNLLEAGVPTGHSGGIVGTLPRMHGGGIVGGERDIRALQNEEVVTADDPRHRWNGGSSPRVEVNITNAGEPLRERSRSQTRTPGGGSRIDIMLEGAINKMSTDGGMDAAMGNYGAGRQVARR